MSTFAWISLALWLTAGCQVYDRVPWRKWWAKIKAHFDLGFVKEYAAPVLGAEEFVPSRYDDAPMVLDVADIEDVSFDVPRPKPRPSSEPRLCRESAEGQGQVICRALDWLKDRWDRFVLWLLWPGRK